MKRSFTSPFLTGVLAFFLVLAAQMNAKATCHALFGYSQTPGTLLVTFQDSSSSSFEITTWHWDFGDGHSSNDHNITHTYAAPGTYEVCLTIHDNHDCNDTYCHAVVVQPVQNNCSAFFEYTQTPNTLTIHFADGSESNHDITSWAWTFGDGGTSDNHAPIHTYDQPGTYQVCLTINDNTGCTSTYCHEVVVSPVNQGGCEAFFYYVQNPNTLNVTFIDSSTSSHTITTWHWDFGDGHSSNDHNISHTYAAAGTYEVCLTIHDNGDCNDTYCTQVVVLPVVPGDCVAFFTWEQTPGTLSVHFTDGSESNHDITSWLWTFGDGHSSDNHAPIHIYDTPGTYEVCLTIHDNTGCTSTYCHAVVVSPIPPGDCTALFTWYQIQGTQTIHFVDSSYSSHDITSYSWNFGDGHEGDGQNPNHYFPVGTYEVCLTIHDNTGCTDTYCTTVTVLPEQPGDCNALFSYEQISGTQNIHFTNLSTSAHDIISNIWIFGDGHDGDGQNPTHEYQNPGTYEVCLIIHDNTGCVDTFCLSVIVEPVTPGECQASFEWAQNPGTQTVHFESTSTSSHEITSYSWSFGDGHNGDAHSPNHTYENAGTYTVCLIIHDNTGCTDTVCHEITVELVIPGPCEAAFQWYQISGTQTIHFVDSSYSAHDIISYSWNFGDGHEGDGQNPNHYFPVGTYEVCLTIVDNTGCTDTYCDSVTVEPEAQGDCQALFTYFQGENNLTIHFIDSSFSAHDITSWHWDFGDGHSSNDHFITHTYEHAGTYEVCLTIHDNHECSDTYCTVVVVTAVEGGSCHALFSFQHEEGSLNVHFTNASTSPDTIISWQWYFGDGSGSDDQNPSHTYAEPGTYHVCLVIHDNHGCVDEYCHDVTLNGNNPQCHAAFSAAVDTAGLTVTFTNTSINTTPNTTYLWQFGDGTTSTEENPVHTYSHHDNYTICLIISDPEADCSSDVCHIIHVFQLGGIHQGAGSDDVHNVARTKGEKDARSEQFISIYPNPASSTTYIEYELTEDADVTIELCDLFGYRVKEVTSAKELKGSHTHSVDAGNLNPGIYIFKVRINQEILIRKISITQ